MFEKVTQSELSLQERLLITRKSNTKKEGINMRSEYDFSNAIKNPYVNKIEKQQITIIH